MAAIPLSEGDEPTDAAERRIRLEAADLLRQRYEDADRMTDAMRVLDDSLALVEDDNRRSQALRRPSRCASSSSTIRAVLSRI